MSGALKCAYGPLCPKPLAEVKTSGWVRCPQGLESEADRVQVAGRLALDDEVGVRGEAAERVAPGVAIEVERDAALVCVVMHEAEAVIAILGSGASSPPGAPTTVKPARWSVEPTLSRIISLSSTTMTVFMRLAPSCSVREC